MSENDLVHRNSSIKAQEAAYTSPRLFVDMDGTLAVFRSVDTLETLYQPHYFSSLPPQENVVEAIRQICLEKPNVEVFILSAVLSDSHYALDEKNAWLDEHLPEIDQAHRIFPPCGEDKKLHIPYGVRPTDFLLDDYSKNLVLWEPPAQGIKLMNGINGHHGTWTGHKVDYRLEPEELAQAIINPIAESTTLDHINTQTVSQSVEAVQPPAPAPMTIKVKAQPPRDRGGNGQVIQAIKEHFDILAYAETRYGLHFKDSTKGWLKCIEHGSMYIDPVAQTFVRHSRGVGGDIINLVAHFEGVSNDEAISKLRGEISKGVKAMPKDNYEAQRVKQNERKEFVLPQKHDGKYSRLFGYLMRKRHIDAKIISDMVKHELLYESAGHHNAVFVGKDYDGQIKSATQRSTGEKKFHLEVEGSQKLGWIVNPDKPQLFIGEAPIDMMSLMTMLNMGGKDYTKSTFIATGGNFKHGIVAYHMQNNPHAKTVYLCYDNDEAGHALAAKALEEIRDSGFKGEIVRKLSKGKDFNDDLIQLYEPTAQQPEAQQEVITPCIPEQ